MYIEFHAHSAFSFLEGASAPEDLVEACADLDMPAIALVDRDGVYGAPRFHMATKKAGLRAHIGSTITCTDGRQYPLLAESREGYQNLCRLITRMKLRAKKGEGAATPEEIGEYARGLICLLRDPRSAVRHHFPGRCYAMLQRHCDRREEQRNQQVIEQARRLHIPLLASNDVRYAKPDRREVFDALTCIRHKTTLATAGRLLDRNSERYLKSPTEMTRLFRDLPAAIGNTGELSSRLQFTLADLGYEFPRYPVGEGESQISFLRKRAEEGARRRYQPYHDRARRQIERELALIEKLKLAGYFLIVWDIVEFCRASGILVQGRGSAANSAVCYSLGITAVDPVGMDLLFERFLSEERGEWPDIDLDLPSGDKRERAIQFVYERYGKLGAAMTANVITYRGRSAAREMGKVLGFDEATVARLAAVVPHWGFVDQEETTRDQFAKAGLDIDQPHVRKFYELYLAVQDLPRHLGQHSGGMVICQGQLDAVVPLEPASMPGRVVVQWDKEDCADLGIIKVDLLGLGMMAAIEDTLTMVRGAYGTEVDLAHLPQDDPKVYAALQEADTVGMFQVESRAQMATLPRLKPEKFYDLVVEVALIRPGPIVGKMVHPYLRRRQGKEAPECLHPSLEPVLRRTLGVPLFQEQLLRMAMIAAGFTGGEAEELRRAMGFKRSEKRMAEIETKLRAGMERNGIPGEAQEAIVRSITSFALYGFPESHAASFALLAYASAYLKVYFPAAFTAALLNNQPMGFYNPATLVKDAQRHGVRVLPVDVAVSDWLCTVAPKSGRADPLVRAGPPGPASLRKADEGVGRGPGGPPYQTPKWQFALEPALGPVHGRPMFRLGLNYVRGLREDAGRAIVERRPFSSIDDLTHRVPELRKDELRQLASVGALNPLERMHRRDALWEAERAARPAGPLLANATAAAGPVLAPMSPIERLAADFNGTGLTVGRHPMAHRRAQLPGVLRAIDLQQARHNHWVCVAGCVIVRQRPGTAKGFVFLTLEDETGISNIIVEPRTFERFREVLTGPSFLLIDGVVQHQDGVIHVKARRVRPLSEGVAATSHDFH